MPAFSTSFEEAWRRFEEGAALVPVAERQERFVAGRAQFLAFQVPVAAMPVADEVEAIQDELADIDALDRFEREMLHITVRGVGFQVIAKTRPDEVLREDVGGIAERAATALGATAPIEVTVGPINVFPDALILEVHDGGALRDLRARLDAIGVADAFSYPPASYLPHITIGVFRTPEVAAALRERLAPLRSRAPVAATIKRVELARWWFTGDDPAEHPEYDTVRSYLMRG